jgi:transposase
MPDKVPAELFLRQWCREVDAAKIPAFMAFANYNGILEGINSKIQLAKRRARATAISTTSLI